jgi:apolipoprotein N-acyltransferase
LCFCKKTRIYSFFLAFIITVFGWYESEIIHPIIEKENDIKVTIVHPCIDQQDKINTEKYNNNLNTHIALSGFNRPYQGKRLIIWPEASFNMNISKEYISSFISYKDTYIFSGADRVDNDGSIYNSSLVINKECKILGMYDKIHLLPFGEFIPDFLMNFGLQKITHGAINFSKGTKTRLISVKNIPDLTPIICYEIAFPGEIVHKGSNPKWIINITNDAWFKGSDEIYQHLRTSVFRAIEEGLPIIRCSNYGISCVIDYKGHITKQLQENIPGKIDTAVPNMTKNTPYSRYGNFLFFLLIAALLLMQRFFKFKNL